MRDVEYVVCELFDDDGGDPTLGDIGDGSVELLDDQWRETRQFVEVQHPWVRGERPREREHLAEAVDTIIASDVEALPPAVMQQTLPEIDAYQYAHPQQRDRVRALLLEAAVAARSDADVRERLRDTMVPRIDMATDAHEEWRDRAGVDRALDMRALVTLIWSADLGLGVLAALGVDLPDVGAWSELMRRMLTSLEAPDAHPGAPTPQPTRRRRS
ncbi:MAG: hypothetical protein QOG65_2618 [Actinomycetota bacterium]|nr:hypothetical protein [Actinomycetota bacterium]